MFLTLQEAKKHIWLAYTPKECIKELTDTCIVGWKDGEVHSLTAIRVNKNGKLVMVELLNIKVTGGQRYDFRYQ